MGHPTGRERGFEPRMKMIVGRSDWGGEPITDPLLNLFIRGKRSIRCFLTGKGLLRSALLRSPVR